jgi:hypothetical protein
MLFYGCLGTQAGHFLLTAHGDSPSYYRLEQMGPNALKYIDGGFLPKNPTHGTIYRSVIPGWTIIAMVDNSVDRRPGSNAEFLVPGEYSTEEMKAMARATFPDIVARLAAFQT